MKKIIVSIIEYLLIGISSFLIIVNIHHIVYINFLAKYELNTSSNQYLKDAKSNIVKAENNFNKINMLQRKVISDSDMITLNEYMSNVFDGLKKSKFYTSKGVVRINASKLSEYNYMSEITNYINSFGVLTKYDEGCASFDELNKDITAAELYGYNDEYRSAYELYSYKVVDTTGQYFTWFIDKLGSRAVLYKEDTSKLLYLTREILRIEGVSYE